MKSISLDSRESSKIKNNSQKCRKFFNDKWQLYQKVLEHNYMGHREMYDRLHRFLVSYFQQPFRIVDLGCGDSSFISQALINTDVASYLGVDLSEIALEIAKSNINPVVKETKFVKEDFRKILPRLLEEERDGFEVIVSSFALHHLTLEQKNTIFNQIHRLLLPGGVFILIDMVVQTTENKDTFLQRYLDGVDRTWLKLTAKEKNLVSQHMWESDFPETEQALQLLARNNGFSKQESIFQNSVQTSQLICFYA